VSSKRAQSSSSSGDLQSSLRIFLCRLVDWSIRICATSASSLSSHVLGRRGRDRVVDSPTGFIVTSFKNLRTLQFLSRSDACTLFLCSLRERVFCLLPRACARTARVPYVVFWSGVRSDARSGTELLDIFSIYPRDEIHVNTRLPFLLRGRRLSRLHDFSKHFWHTRTFCFLCGLRDQDCCVLRVYFMDYIFSWLERYSHVFAVLHDFIQNS